jgi:hypothetical protein
MADRSPSSGWRHALVITAAAVLSLSACGSDSDTEADSGLGLRLVIPDTNIREPDVPCSGARGFRFAHPQAPFAVEDGSGTVVATGVLPEGRAEKAFNIDLGDERQPTVCVMTLDVPDVETLDGHLLVIADRSPIPIGANPSLDDMPEVVLR